MVDIHRVGLSEFDEPERARAETRLERLSHSHNDLIDLRIAGHRSHHHNHGAQEVRITCLARGRKIVAARTRADLGLALNDAMTVFEGAVQRLREKRKSKS